MPKYDIYRFVPEIHSFRLEYRSIRKKECRRIIESTRGLYLAVPHTESLIPFSDSPCLAFCCSLSPYPRRSRRKRK
jgi:hypothetical protein